MRFLRGRRGTEWAAREHAAGEAFSTIFPGSVLTVPVSTGAIGAEVQLVAAGVGDSLEGVSAVRLVSGETVRPPPPVHLKATREANGDIHLAWTRRSRLGWTWAIGSDTPLGEEREHYRIAVASAAATRHFETGESHLLYPVAEQAADGITGALTISVSQIGTHASSRETHVALG